MTNNESLDLIKNAIFYQDDTSDMGETLDHTLEHVSSTREQLGEALSQVSTIFDKYEKLQDMVNDTIDKGRP